MNGVQNLERMQKIFHKRYFLVKFQANIAKHCN